MDDFKALQQKWYGILREAGFVDIEISGKLWDLHKYYGALHPVRRMAREQYYRLINLAIADESVKFKSEIDRYIMHRHAEGTKINAIAQELDERDMSRSVRSIRVIIRRYEMAWGIRTYTPQQLNRYYLQD